MKINNCKENHLQVYGILRFIRQTDCFSLINTLKLFFKYQFMVFYNEKCLLEHHKDTRTFTTLTHTHPYPYGTSET